MHNARIREEKQLESVLCESDLGFELLDMLAQANIDFRRLPQEELRNLMASFRTGGEQLATTTRAYRWRRSTTGVSPRSHREKAGEEGSIVSLRCERDNGELNRKNLSSSDEFDLVQLPTYSRISTL